MVAVSAATACGSTAAPTNSAPQTATAVQSPFYSPFPAPASTCVATSGSSPAPAPGTWPTYMGGAQRSGVGPAAPVAHTGRCAWVAIVDGEVYGEPLVAGTSVIATTEHDTVYALDAATGRQQWHTHLGNPVPLAELLCGDIDPNGVTSTPVLDAAAGMVYVVAMLDAPIRHEIFGLRLADGRVMWHRGADPPGADPRVTQQRGSLNLVNGRVYFSFGGFAGDCGRYHGWVVAAPAGGSGSLLVFQVPSVNEGAIWAPPGPVISSAGDVWVSTGNTAEGLGATTGSYDDANAVIRIAADLSRAIDLWAPSDWRALNVNDGDLGSGAPALLPGGDVFISGKDGIGYLLRAGHLGGVAGEAFAATVCPNGGAGRGVYGGDAVTGATVFAPCGNGLTALRVDAVKPSFRTTWRDLHRDNSPIVAYGLVWTVQTEVPSDDWTGTLVGLDPATGAERVRVALGPVPHFPSPAAAGGNLYVAGRGAVYAVSIG